MSDHPSEDLIESVQRPQPAWRRRVDRLLHRPATAAALLVVGLIAGSVSGYVVGHANPQTLAGAGYLLNTFERPEQMYGRPGLPMLTVEDLTALGEQVHQEQLVGSAQSAVPVLCDTGLGQPGTPDFRGLSYPAIVFGVEGGQLTELVWPQADEAAASGILRTLVSQARECPNVPSPLASITTGGSLSGIGDEYAVFTRQPTSPAQSAYTTTAVLVRLGPDLIEISFVADGTASVDPEARCLRGATAAVERAGG